MRKTIFIFFFMIMLYPIFIPRTQACPTCGCTVCLLGKGNSLTAQSRDQKWYFRYLYDQLVWRETSAESANALLNDGHDVHDKVTEVAHHYELGRHVTDDLNVFVDLPYMVRTAIEFADPDHLGEKQRSQGIGDLQLIGDYRFWHNAHNAVSLVGGVKFPSGETHEKNSQGERFETDMQPGTGAYNYIVGGIYKLQGRRLSLTANTSYVFTTKGAQGFEYGDLYTISVYGDYLVNPGSKYFQTHAGVDIVFQDEWKEKTNGEKNPDSGGQTVLLGPSLRVNTSRNVSLTATFLYPVSQDLNGLTQRQLFEWMLGAEIRF